jgi:hypothetical protein
VTHLDLPRFTSTILVPSGLSYLIALTTWFLLVLSLLLLVAIDSEYLIDSPAPINLSYFWGFGSLLGLNLIVLVVSGVTLAMHYTPNTF